MKKSVSELSLTNIATNDCNNKYSLMIKNAGWDIHTHIHRHEYASKLLSRKFSVDDYGMYIIQLFHIYDTNHPNANGHLLMAYSLLEKILQ